MCYCMFICEWLVYVQKLIYLNVYFISEVYEMIFFICICIFNEMLNCYLVFIIDLFVCIYNSNSFYFIVYKLFFYINLQV